MSDHLPNYCFKCEKDVPEELSIHIFLYHTKHSWAYCCTICDYVDVVTQRFRRHVSNNHNVHVPDPEPHFQRIEPFARLHTCEKMFCDFRNPWPGIMRTHYEDHDANVVSSMKLRVAMWKENQMGDNTLQENLMDISPSVPVSRIPVPRSRQNRNTTKHIATAQNFLIRQTMELSRDDKEEKKLSTEEQWNAFFVQCCKEIQVECTSPATF